MSRNILIVGFDGAQVLDVTGPAQIFSAADQQIGGGAYRVRLVGPTETGFETTSGIRLPVDLTVGAVSDMELDSTDTLLIAGGGGSRAHSPEVRSIDALTARAQGRVRRIVSVCTGAFFLARSGILAGRRVTTHWAWADVLQRISPTSTVDVNAIYLEDDGVWTSAGVTAGIDLCLALVEEDLGRSHALALAREHVVYRIRPGGQSQFAGSVLETGTGHARLDALASRVAQQPGRDWRLESLAETAAVSTRTLTRLFQTHARISPARFVERLRIDLACTALTDTAEPIARVAESAGFGALRRMERAFLRNLNVSPSEYRARFRAPNTTAR